MGIAFFILTQGLLQYSKLEPFFSIDLHCEKARLKIIFYYNPLFNNQY